ncbi:MAG: Holliday junction branch migration protein RuvA [Firmicutes bacterium]|nr:Holliday junction branch migration protein RuvA [Bacillota bacterium]
MIARLKGVLVLQADDFVIIDVGGVGYRVYVPGSTRDRLPGPGQEACIFTHTHVREDAILLYGFATWEERELFEALIGVSGIGPKVALSILSSMEAEEFRRAIMGADEAILTNINGIGKKTAQRLILELKDKLGSIGFTGGIPGAQPGMGVQGMPGMPGGQARRKDSDPAADAVEALVALGYSPVEAARAVQKARAEGGTADGAADGAGGDGGDRARGSGGNARGGDGSDGNLEALIRRALKLIG